ncbi:hypothetical protein ABBQ38_005921 [Trebouxia sp. C0009 RCD-2024]
MAPEGATSPDGPAASTSADVKPDLDQTEHITLHFVSQERHPVPIKVRRTTPFEKMFVAYRNKFSLSEGDVRFVVEGQRVKPFHTPAHHHLNDGDEVEAILEMVGGQ